MDEDSLKTGKAQVREILIEPLVRAGMVRKSGVKASDLAEMFAALEARLAYMAAIPDALEALAEQVRRCGDGPRGDRWPAQVAIERMAAAIAPPPASDSAMVRRWFAVFGRRAVGEDWAIEAWRELKSGGRWFNPGLYAHRRCVEIAEGRRREETRLRAALAAGAISSADRRWLADLDALRARIAELAAAGRDAA